MEKNESFAIKCLSTNVIIKQSQVTLIFIHSRQISDLTQAIIGQENAWCISNALTHLGWLWQQQ